MRCQSTRPSRSSILVGVAVGGVLVGQRSGNRRDTWLKILGGHIISHQTCILGTPQGCFLRGEHPPAHIGDLTGRTYVIDPQVTGGQFVGPKGYKGPTQIGEAPPYTTDQAADDRLWAHLEKATGVTWP